MSIYVNYIELTPVKSKVKERVARKPFGVAEIYRRTISTAINTLHHYSTEKSVGGYAVAILEAMHKLPDGTEVSVQSKIRIFTKKASSLEHVRRVLLGSRFFSDFFKISDLKVVPENCSYSAFIRVRLPTVKKSPNEFELKKSSLDSAPDCNFIYLMPSSSVRGNKRLVRYYYRPVQMECLKVAQFSKPDSYGFSRSTRLCTIPTFV